jgi:signal transduction histidine kinase
MRRPTAGAGERRPARTNGRRAAAPPSARQGGANGLAYSAAVTATTIPATPPRTGFRRVFAWPRLRFTLAVAAGLGFVSGLHNQTAVPVDVLRAMFMGCVMLLAFGLLETRPRMLPQWLPRTVLRLIGVVLAIPLSAMFMSAVSPATRGSMSGLVGAALLFAPWIAIAAIFRRRDMLARERSFAFELERSEYERRESDARLRQLQAQVEPHFLFNTLANVQALVDSGSPQASKVLNSLISYLRAAVPRMHSQTTTLTDEVDLARAYLEIMQMRIPDRLQYAIHLDPAAARLRCPPIALLTLVENAVRHGIDPSEVGGRIDIDIWLRDQRCVIRVKDSGVGLRQTSRGLGTGLSTLRERLKLAFGEEAQLKLTSVEPHGVCAEIDFPVREPSG